MLIDDIIAGLQMLPIKKVKHYQQSVAKFTNLLENSTRFNLDDSVTRAVTQLIAVQPTALQANLEFARRPYRSMWVEFAVKPRIDTLESLGVTSNGGKLFPPHPSRIGIYLDDHPDYPDDLLCGRAIVGWRHHATNFGEVAYTELYWDYRDTWKDWRTPQEIKLHIAKTAAPTSLSYLHKGNPAQLEAYTELMARYSTRAAWPHLPWIKDFLSKESDEVAQKFIGASQGDATSESTTILGILLLFNTTKALAFDETDYTKLNRSRERIGKPPLLSHKTASFYLSKARKRSYTAKGLTVQQGVVLQRVSGSLRSRYSIKRGTRQLFWVDPYQRGDITYGIGPSITKIKTVKLPTG